MWSVSIIPLKDNGYRYKVTRRLSQYLVFETKLFRSKKKAEAQFKQWLKQGDC